MNVFAVTTRLFLLGVLFIGGAAVAQDRREILVL